MAYLSGDSSVKVSPSMTGASAGAAAESSAAGASLAVSAGAAVASVPAGAGVVLPQPGMTVKSSVSARRSAEILFVVCFMH